MTGNPLRILTLSSLYPTPLRPTFGIFTHDQVRALRDLGCETVVVAPQLMPLVSRSWFAVWRTLGRIPRTDVRDDINIVYPRYVHVPKSIAGRHSFYIPYRQIKKQITEVIRAFRPDLLHVHTATPDGVIGTRVKEDFGLPMLLTVRGSDIYAYPYQSEVAYRVTKNVLTRTDQVIAASRALKRKSEEIASPSREIAVIYDGCDHEAFRFKEKDRAALRAHLNIPGGAAVFIFVGNILKEKGAIDLFDAFCDLLDARSDSYLVYVGDGRQRNLLAHTAADRELKDRVMFAGLQPHHVIPRWLSMADVIVLPSHSEGLGNVIVEAMACMKPVIATRVGGIPETVVEGSSGFLVEPQDRTSLTEYMQRLAQDRELRAAMGTVGREIVLDKFSRTKNTGQLIELYRKVLG